MAADDVVSGDRSDDEGPHDPAAMSIGKRHHMEKMALKKQCADILQAANKGDKNAKKQAKVRVKQLEAELKERHERESRDSAQVAGDDVKRLADAVDRVEVGDRTSKKERRQARRAAEDAARRLALEDELKNVEDPRQVEIDMLSSKLSTLGMAIKEIRPDGHCLYHAVADQLERIGETIAGPRHATLRQRASSYMLENADAFLPFMLTDEGALLSEKEFETHCAAIVDTNDVVWGGQPELSALAAAFQCRIIVYSSDADPIVMGDADDGRTLRVSFHRHYLMGHHYNSVVPNDVQQ
ncbi:unnamed protein product (mitochondrion) [Plasmodiophora brassicae]|uniref:OTU domain-containing protein n=1 Tax=Plasmodiophora brassicae TaxID=37360 RepID=A0A0G4J7W9_PLABS|nr:hypothetical protein PBRA_003305 [Plasmodiophora brassicae]SPQ99662.1 unnamed protein product [Plasmodiophora brassicae]